MPAPVLDSRNIDFMLYELFDADQLTKRERYRDHNRESFEAIIATARRIADTHILPMRRRADSEPLVFRDGRVSQIPEINRVVGVLRESGLGSAECDSDEGGVQLPSIVASAAYGYVAAAGGALLGYMALTTACANLISAHGSAAQKASWLAPLRSQRFLGTMAMTEPEAGAHRSLICAARPASRPMAATV